MIHNHTPTTSMEKIQSQPKISRKKLEKKMRKIFHKKIGVLSEMCISDNTPNRYSKSRRHPKIRRRNGRPISQSDDHSLSASKRLRPRRFPRLLLQKRKRQKSPRWPTRQPAPVSPLCRAPKESTGRAHANRHALCPISFTKRPGQKPSRPPDGNRPA